MNNNGTHAVVDAKIADLLVARGLSSPKNYADETLALMSEFAVSVFQNPDGGVVVEAQPRRHDPTITAGSSAVKQASYDYTFGKYDCWLGDLIRKTVLELANQQ